MFRVVGPLNILDYGSKLIHSLFDKHQLSSMIFKMTGAGGGPGSSHRPYSLGNGLALLVVLGGVFALVTLVVRAKPSAQLKTRHGKEHMTITFPVVDVDDRCRGVFTIGAGGLLGNSSTNDRHHLQQTINTLVQARDRDFGAPVDLYTPLLGYLPQMLTLPDKGLTGYHQDKLDNSTIFVKKDSPLEQAKGRLDYIPCELKIDSINHLRECVMARAADREGKRLWIAFVGDSKVRVRFDYLLNQTQHWANWSVTINGVVQSYNEYRELSIKKGIQITAVASSSTYGISLSMVWASQGLWTEPNFLLPKVPELQWWQGNHTEKPHVIIIEFGTWIWRGVIAEEGMSNLAAPDLLLVRWIALGKALTQLAANTHLLLLAQTRYRIYKQGRRKGLNTSSPAIAAGVWWSDKLYRANYYDDTTDWIDMAMAYLSRNSGAWIWDSSLPHNLANRKDCELLTENQLTNTTEYLSDELRCSDGHHPSAMSVKDEMVMLVNLLCNRHLRLPHHFCCT